MSRAQVLALVAPLLSGRSLVPPKALVLRVMDPQATFSDQPPKSPQTNG